MTINAITPASALKITRNYEEIGPVCGTGNGFFSASNKKMAKALAAMCEEAEAMRADAVIIINFNFNSAEILDGDVTVFGMAIKYIN